jgi:hypothetical protein
MTRKDDIQEIIEKYEDIKSESEKLTMDWKKFCDNMDLRFEDLKKKNNANFWKVAGVIITIFFFMMGFTLKINREAESHITKDDVAEVYVTKKDFMLLYKFNTDLFTKVLAIDKAGISDSLKNELIREAFDQYDFTLNTIWEDYGSRTVIQNEKGYSDMLDKIKNYEK